MQTKTGAAYTKSEKDAVSRAALTVLWQTVRLVRPFSLHGIGLVARAISLAIKWHGQNHQRRSYGVREPYVLHPFAVAIMVLDTGDATYEQVAAAVLHDIVEDTDMGFHVPLPRSVKLTHIRFHFGRTVELFVDDLTDVAQRSDGNRKKRAAMNLDHLRGALARSQTIKLADILHNTLSMILGSPEFTKKVWMPEKIAQVEVLGLGDADLRQSVMAMQHAYLEGRLTAL